MKRFKIFALLLCLLCSNILAQVPQKIGSDGIGQATFPAPLLVEQESEKTVFIMPSKNDPEGPISMRFSFLRDLQSEKLASADIKKFLQKINKTEKVEQAGRNWFSTSKEKGSSEDGTKWLYTHYSIFADNLLITATVQTIAGRENDPQCKVLWDAVPGILESIGRNTGAAADDWKSLSDAAEKLLYQEHDLKKAVETYDKAIALQPDNPGLYANRGNAYSYQDNLAKALPDYDKAIALAVELSGSADAKNMCPFYYNKAYAYDRADHWAEAIPLYEKVIKIDSGYPDAKGHLAWILATAHDASLRNPQRAIELAQAEMKSGSAGDPDTTDTLAAAYAAQGNFKEAIEWQKKALSLVKTDSGKKVFEERLRLYESGKAYVSEKKN